MDKKQLTRGLILPMLRIVKQAMLDARNAGATEEDVKKMMSAVVEECCAKIEDQEDRAWLIEELGEAIGAREKKHAPLH